MYTAFLDQTLSSIVALKRHLATSEALRSSIAEGVLRCKNDVPCFAQLQFSVDATPERIEWRVIDHCTAVTRIYAIYEQFAQEMLREHISLLQSRMKFDDLSSDLKKAYRKGLAEILLKKDGPRYGNLNLSDIISQYDRALSGKSYALEPQALLITEQNLRIPELNRLYAASGISNVDGWIEKHSAVMTFFSPGGRLGASAEHEMAELIKYRNDAAHGSMNVDNLLGLDYLFEFCDFIASVCIALSERVQMTGIDCLLASGGAEKRGNVSESFRSNLVLIAKVTGRFAVGDTIYLYGESYCMKREILSLQLDDVPLEELTLVEATEVGFGINEAGRKNSQIVVVNAQAPNVIVAAPLLQAVDVSEGVET